MDALFTHFLNFEALWNARIVMADGAIGTLRLGVVTLVLAPLVGAAVLALQMLPVPIIGKIMEWYVDIMRAFPLLVFLVISYYLILPIAGLRIDAFTAAMVGFALKHGVYFTEIYRSGYLSVDRGQVDAAKVIGLTRTKALRLVIVPQMLIIMLPPLTSQITLIMRDLPLAFVIGHFELLTSARAAQVFTRNSTPLFGAVVLYAVTLLFMQWLTGRVEAYSRRRMET